MYCDDSLPYAQHRCYSHSSRLRLVVFTHSTDCPCRVLGAGAESLGDAIWGPDIPEKDRASQDVSGQGLTIEQWSRLIDAFFEWPFAPKVRLDATCCRTFLTFLSEFGYAGNRDNTF